MRVFFFFALFILVFGGLAHYNNHRMKVLTNTGETELSMNKNKNNYGIWYYFLFVGMWFIQSFRYYVGADFPYYFRMDVDWEFVVTRFQELDEPIIYLLSFLARSIWDHPLANIMMFSFVLTLLLFIGMKRYDDNDLLVMLLMYTFVGGFLFSLNGVAQALAVLFVFAFSNKAKKNWVLKYLVVVLIAFLIHKSVLMLIPILILSQFKINKYQMTLLIACGCAIPLFYDLGYSFMEVSNFESGYIQEVINPIRVLVAFSPIILLYFIDRKKFCEENYFICNMMIFNAIMTFTTMGSAYLNRFCRYTSVFLIVFIAKCLKEFPKRSRIIVSIIVLMLYFGYWMYEIYNSDYLRNFYWIFPYMDYFKVG